MLGSNSMIYLLINMKRPNELFDALFKEFIEEENLRN